MTLSNIIGGLFFSIIGLGAFRYGKQLDLWKPKAIGLGMMLYPYFCWYGWLTWSIGIGLCTLLWFHHNE
jgi:hypothetical protein